MDLNVRQRGDQIATFRWIEVRLMETLAAWVPSTPEMEVKLLLGEHIWEVAQHADALGKRTLELRLPMHDDLEPARPYVEWLASVRATTDTAKRIAGLYRCVLPALERRYRDYLHRVDPLLDGPTVRIVERILGDGARMMRDGQALCDSLPAIRLGDEAWLAELRERETRIGEIVVYRTGEPSVASVA